MLKRNPGIYFEKPNSCVYICNQIVAIKQVYMRRDIFQAIADPTRRAILVLIAAQAMTPNGLAEHFDTTRQAVSKHLKILTECELVKQEYQGREIYYQLEIQKMKEIDKWLEQFRKIWEVRFNQLDKILAKQRPNKK
jgi:DNA-binding transcriptional ArsR family regulator